MDYVVVQLCMAEAFPDEAFSFEKQSGALILGPLAKRILIQSVNDYLDEIISLKGKPQGRISHIEDDMHKLAKYFLKHGKV